MEMYDYRCLNSNEIFDVIKEAKYCMLGGSRNNKPYLIPMYYCWAFTNKELNFILVSKEQGQKIDFINNNDKVYIELKIDCKDCIKTVIADCVVANINKQNCDFACTKIFIKSISGREYGC